MNQKEAPVEPDLEKKPRPRWDNRLAAGVLLILFGAAALLQRWFDIGSFVVLLLGLFMLVWGVISRRTGWIIPGGVLTGIGLGILALEGPWQFPAPDQDAVFLLCFAFGWFLIAILTAVFTSPQWWALIPGGIMALIGSGILVTNGAIPWKDLSLVYAAILIAVGLFLILRKGRPGKDV
jgi:uncharacterized membrane protein HdeD (DUF308 family)